MHIKFKSIEVGHLSALNVRDMTLYWSNSIALFKTEISHGGASWVNYNIANPLDWRWLTDGGRKESGSVHSSELCALFDAADKEWTRVRQIALLCGAEWLDAPYFDIAMRGDTDAYILSRKAIFIATQDSGAQIISRGKFFSNMNSPRNHVITTDMFIAAFNSQGLQVAYIDLRRAFERDDLDFTLFRHLNV